MKILYFSPIEWSFIRQRPQHLSQGLSCFWPLTYVQPLGLRNFNPFKGSDWNRAARRMLSLLQRDSSSSQSLGIKNPLFFPVSSKPFDALNRGLLKRQLRSLVDPETLLWVTTPNSVIHSLLPSLTFKGLIYEMMDDYPQMHPSRASQIQEMENDFIRRAHLVITSSSLLFRKAREIENTKKILLVTNSVDFDFFSTSSPSVPGELKGPRKKVGYIGTIDSWLDFEAIGEMAQKREDLDFVFVGPLKTSPLPQKPNLHFLGTRDYSQIPGFCRAFDVCLIPFRPGPFADSVNPVKLYEYFALGKPVVAPPMEELLPYREILYLAEKREDYPHQMERALEERDDFLMERRREVARQNDWSQKIEQIRAGIEEVFLK